MPDIDNIIYHLLDILCHRCITYWRYYVVNVRHLQLSVHVILNIIFNVLFRLYVAFIIGLAYIYLYI